MAAPFLVCCLPTDDSMQVRNNCLLIMLMLMRCCEDHTIDRAAAADRSLNSCGRHNWG